MLGTDARFGTCGGISPEARAGSIVVASKGAGFITRNVDAFAYNYDGSSDASSCAAEVKYRTSRVAPPCAELSALVTARLVEALGAEVVVEGTNVTADSFYSTQGRIDPNFDDANHSVVETIRAAYPDAKSLEMESFMLLHLAKCSKIPISGTSATIVISNPPKSRG